MDIKTILAWIAMASFAVPAARAASEGNASGPDAGLAQRNQVAEPDGSVADGNGETPPEPPDGFGGGDMGMGPDGGNGEMPPEPPGGIDNGDGGNAGRGNGDRGYGRRGGMRRGGPDGTGRRPGGVRRDESGRDGDDGNEANGESGNAGRGNGDRGNGRRGGMRRGGMRRGGPDGTGRRPGGVRRDGSGRDGDDGNGANGDGGNARRGRGGRGYGHRGGMGMGPGGMRRGGPGGMRRGDDPSDPSRYSGVVEATAAFSTNNVSIITRKADMAPLYAKAGGALTVDGGTIRTDASGANAVLAIGKGAKADVANLRIETAKDSSRGLYAFMQGEIRARNVRISTKGAHCAGMATDRGEGVVSVDGGTIETEGDGSPCIYSTGTLSARNVKGAAKGSEAMVIEGRNSIYVEKSDLTGYRKCGAMLYQSFSGDAMDGTAKLTMRNSRIEAKTGPVFFVTNTKAEIDISGSKIAKSAGAPLLKAAPARWGRSGSNGGSVTLRAERQELSGDVEVSPWSSATIDLRDGAVLKGALDAKGTAKELRVKLAKGAKLVLTGDSHATAIENEDPTGANIVKNGHKLTVGPGMAAAERIGGNGREAGRGNRRGGGRGEGGMRREEYRGSRRAGGGR